MGNIHYLVPLHRLPVYTTDHSHFSLISELCLCYLLHSAKKWLDYIFEIAEGVCIRLVGMIKFYHWQHGSFTVSPFQLEFSIH